MDTSLSAWRSSTQLFPSPAHRARAVLTMLAPPDDTPLGEALDTLGPEHVLDLIKRACSIQADGGSGRSGQRPKWVQRAAHRWKDQTIRAALDSTVVPEEAEKAGVRFLIPSDPHWPKRLDRLGHRRPYGLWVWGMPDRLAALLSAQAVSIVGSRAATPYGKGVALELPSALAGTGWVTTSGGARGIDAAAHQGSLEKAVPTLVMLPCGLDIAYPPEHRQLFARVRRHGLLVSEVGPGCRASRALFFARNRLVAASTATVVVEATPQSGTMHTVDQAMRLGTRCWRCPAHSPRRHRPRPTSSSPITPRT